MIKLLIIEEQELVKQGLVAMLGHESDIHIVDAVTDADAGIAIARAKEVDVVLLDLKVSCVGGLETIRRLARISDTSRVLIISSFYNHPFPYRALQAGAVGFVSKSSTGDILLQAVKSVHAGQKYMSQDIAQQLALQSVSDAPEDASPFDSLSSRELQVMMMITNGIKVQEISDKLCLSPKTVNSYRYRLFEKLNVNNDVELTHLAIANGLVDLLAHGYVIEELTEKS